MEQPTPEESRDIVPKSEGNLTSMYLVVEPETDNPCSTNPQISNTMDPIKRESEDPTYTECPGKNEPVSDDIKPKRTTKRKAAPMSFNNDGEAASDPETKPAPKKTKQTKAATKPKDSTAGTRKKPNGAGNPRSTKPGVKSKNQLVKEGRDARRECKDLKSEIKAKDHEICHLQKVMANLQNQYFSLLRKSNAGFMDDSLVRQKLFDLREACKAWSRKYSVPGRLPDLDASNMKALISSLTSKKCPVSNGANFLVAGSLQYGSSIILNALLVQFICSQIIEQPFFFLQAWEIKDFLDNVSALSTDSVHDWVSQTVEMLFPTSLEGTTGDSSCVWDGTLESKDGCIGGGAKEFINGLPAILLGSQDEDIVDERLTSLGYILKDAGDIAIQLRKQRVGVRCLYIDSSNLTQNGFQSNSKLIEPHHCMCLEEGSHLLDGEDIIMIIEPAIVAYWTGSDGMEKEKIWAKSVVWVDGWDKVHAKDGTKKHERLITTSEAQHSPESPPVASTITIPHTRTDNGQGSEDGMMYDQVDVAAVQSTSHPNNNDNPSKNVSEVIDDPMCIVDDGDVGDIVMQDTENNGRNGSQGPSLTTGTYHNPSSENSQNTLEALSLGPDHPPGIINNLEPMALEKVELSAGEERNISTENLSPAFSVVIPESNTSGTRRISSSPPSSKVKTEPGTEDTDGGSQDTISHNLESVKGEIATLKEKQGPLSPLVHIRVEPVREGDRVSGQSVRSGMTKDAPIEVEEDDEDHATFKGEAMERTAPWDMATDTGSVVNESANDLYNEASKALNTI